MTDHPSDPDPTPSDAEEAGVRRLLAEARHDGPVPAEVAARLDAALAGLRDGAGPPPEGDRGARVADLTTRRRRAGRILVAAAAAVVVGVGIGVVHDHTGSLAGAGSSAGSATSGDSAAGGGSATGPRTPAYLPHTLGRPVRLAPSRFAEQVLRLRRGDRTSAPAGSKAGLGARPGDTLTNGTGTQPAPDRSACVPGGGGRAVVVVPVRYAGDPGLLAFRRPAGDSQVVDLYLCGQDRPVRSITLPAR